MWHHVRRIFMWTVAIFWCILTMFFLSWKCWVPPITDMFKFDCQVSFPAADSIAFCPGGGQTQPLLIIHWKYLSWTDHVLLPVLDLSRPLKHGTHGTVDCLSRSPLQRQTGWWQEGSTVDNCQSAERLLEIVTRMSPDLGFAGVMAVPGSESKKSIPSVNCTLDALWWICSFSFRSEHRPDQLEFQTVSVGCPVGSNNLIVDDTWW